MTGTPILYLDRSLTKMRDHKSMLKGPTLNLEINEIPDHEVIGCCDSSILSD